MTLDELRQEVREEINDVREAVNDMRADVTAIKAVTDAIGERRDAETAAQWTTHREMDGRVRRVEVDYAPKSDVQALTTRINELEKQVARIAAWGIAAMTVVQALGFGGLYALLKSGGH